VKDEKCPKSQGGGDGWFIHVKYFPSGEKGESGKGKEGGAVEGKNEGRNSRIAQENRGSARPLITWGTVLEEGKGEWIG